LLNPEAGGPKPSMSGYRFCRTDDLALLVEAYNACWLPHFPGESSLTIDQLKRTVRDLNLWASSSMLALEDNRPVGCLLGAKRSEANFVYRIAMLPGHERRGHGRHLLTSLAQKVAILGPPRLLAEVPAQWDGARGFFERCGFQVEARYADFVLAEAFKHDEGERASSAVIPITFDELLESAALDESAVRSWERSVATLRNRRRELGGLAVASDVRIEAHLLHRIDDATEACEIVALGAASESPGRALLALLIRALRREERRPIRIPKVSEGELTFATLRSFGFRIEREWVGYALDARAC
jgi:ribosomal protein S18 acetylase RimI-like enzyme